MPDIDCTPEILLVLNEPESYHWSPSLRVGAVVHANFYLGDTIHHLQHSQLQTMMFLQLVAGGHLMLFVVRTRGPFWKPPYPSPRLFFAIVATQIAAVFMCSQGWLVPPLSWGIIGFVWAYNIVWMLVQDIVKLGLYHILDPAHSWKRSLFAPLRTPVTNAQKAVR